MLLQGFVYVEAMKEAHVREAIRGLRTIFISKGVKLVPTKEMVDAITVTRQKKALFGTFPPPGLLLFLARLSGVSV